MTRSSTTPRLRHVAAAIVSGLILRIALVLLCHEDVPGGDAIGYQRLALNLASHNAYSLEDTPPFTPTVVRAPFTALALSVPYRVFGASEVAAHMLLIFTALAGVLVLALGVGKHVPALAVPILWVLSMSPFGALYASRLLSETFASAAISIAVGSLLLLAPARGSFVAGCALAVAALTRDVNLPLIVLLPVGAFALTRGSGSALRFRHVLLSLGASAVVIAPWTVRNVLVGTPALISKGLMGVNLWIGTWERNPNWMHGNHDYPPEAFNTPDERRTVAELRQLGVTGDAGFRAMAIQRIRTEPMKTLGVWARRSPYLWIGSRTELFEFRSAALARGSAGWMVLKSAAWALNLLVLGFSVLGVFYVIKTRHALRLLLIPIVFTAAVYFPFHSTENRYSEPVYAQVIVLAILGMVGTSQRLLAFWPKRSQPKM